jgi:peptidoglycan/LPS O-acetylase OafA/YrhL
MQTLGYPLVALAFAALILRLLAAPDGARLRRAFEWRPLRVLGRYSYAIYLLHVPILYLAGPWFFDPLAKGWPPAAAQLCIWAQMLAACWIAGALSWRLLEQPLLGLRRYFPYRPDPDAAPIPR